MENNREWSEISVTVASDDIETAANIANMTVPYGIHIEDYSALEEETLQTAHVDLIDEELLKRDREHGIIHIYINPHENPYEAVSFITERLNAENIANKIEVSKCVTEDWVNHWKQYFHPMPIGEKLLIHPIWEENYDAGGRAVLHIEPGLAFGTGSHPTTKLCLEALENYINEGAKVLDVGCGSGILSVASLLLGAKSALGVDIDSLAVKTALDNAEKNGFYPPAFTAVQGNLSDKVKGKFNVVVANIVADIIMEFNKSVSDFLEEDGVYITGGIIDLRRAEVVESFGKYGFEIIEHREEKGWNVFVCKKAVSRSADM